MHSLDLKRRADWLRAVSERLSARDVAAILAEYADELEAKAVVAERRSKTTRLRSIH
jgi:hypothetical protein